MKVKGTTNCSKDGGGMIQVAKQARACINMLETADDCHCEENTQRCRVWGRTIIL